MAYNEENLNVLDDWRSGHFSSISDNLPSNIPQPIELSSYPPLTTKCPSCTLSSKRGSLSTLQISLIALKDRCLKQQRKLDLLEDENSRLYYALGVSDLPYKDELFKNKTVSSDIVDGHLEALNRLQEANFLLRQRNLKLSQKLSHNKSELTPASKSSNLADDSLINTSSKLERTMEYNKNSSKRNIIHPQNANGFVNDSDEEEDEEEDYANNELDNIVGNTSDKSLIRVQLTEQNMQELKEKLLCQQQLMVQTMKKISSSLTEPKNQTLNSGLIVNKNIHSVLGKITSPLSSNKMYITEEEINAEDIKKDIQRLCPMCEANFPYNEILQEDFEAHVLGHFSYEDEAETLTHYDMVLDAQRSLDGDL